MSRDEPIQIGVVAREVTLIRSHVERGESVDLSQINATITYSVGESTLTPGSPDFATSTSYDVELRDTTDAAGLIATARTTYRLRLEADRELHEEDGPDGLFQEAAALTNELLHAYHRVELARLLTAIGVAPVPIPIRWADVQADAKPIDS